MLHTIKSRLQKIEQAKKNVAAPEVVFIYWDDLKQSWVAKEQYAKRNLRGQVINKTGREKKIMLDCPEDYEVPEGFRGTILIEGELK